MPPQRKLYTLRELLEDEHKQLEEAAAAEMEASKPNATHHTRRFDGEVKLEGSNGEPWLARTSTDRVGLALSGGGIRSATFGLGLLQALARQGVLKLVDYMSTVSGGGYLGGFLTAWKQREGKNEVFPLETEHPRGTAPDKRERPEIRHLREFSRFLSPRIGVNEPEMWYAVAAVLGGLVPALLATLALVALVFYGWLGAGYLAFIRPDSWDMPKGCLFAAMVALLIVGVMVYRRSNRRTRRHPKWRAAYIGVIVAGELGLLAVYYWLLPVKITPWMLVFAAASLILHGWREWRAYRELRSEPGAHEGFWMMVYWIFAIVTVALGMWLVDYCVGLLNPSKHWGWTAGEPLFHGTKYLFAFGWEPIVAHLEVAIGYAANNAKFSTLTFEPAIAWICLALIVSAAWIVIEGIARGVDLLFPSTKPGSDSLRQMRLRRSDVREKLASRYIAWALCLAAGVGIWEFAFWLDHFLSSKAMDKAGLATSGGLTAVFAGLFAWLRDWLKRPDKEDAGGTAWEKIKRAFKDWIPAIAASAGAISLIVFAILLMRHYGLRDPANGLRTIYCAGVALAVVLIALKFFDPAYFGLHDFYRARIARAYLGAAFVRGETWTRYRKERRAIKRDLNKAVGMARRHVFAAWVAATKIKLPPRIKRRVIDDAKVISRSAADMEMQRKRRVERLRFKPSSRDNRFTGERAADDICLTNLPNPTVRPLHLICCAANHLSGDDLPNLYRGARSAVISQRGISLGDDTLTPSEDDAPLMLSAAQTASAAAFNSQMGEKSIHLGRGSSFLMTALNLRLGLWVLNPLSVREEADRDLLQNALKGKFITRKDSSGKVLQFLGRIWRSMISIPGKSFFAELVRSSKCLPGDGHSHLHLSDGGHFENLGLYELIRRHCTYIIVSDAGQDETVAFDDLGNAVRRVREDFGVEIEIDLDPIRPNDQLISRQHLVVGTIHYDGYEGSDKGTLIYIKPTLTGDEPGDIQQYRTRNQNFPHESTGDQFFSEAQWESYRRLGEHVGQVAFEFLNSMTEKQREQAETVFWRARSVWSVLPAGYEEKFEELNNQARDLDTEICQSAPEEIRAEFFPELGAAVPPASPADEIRTVYYVLRILLLMENAWLRLDLKRYWAHAMNDGWMNYFHRWASTPSFRRWWPILSPLFSIDFRDFIKSRFALGLRDPIARPADAEKPGPQLTLRHGAPSAAILAGHTAQFLANQGKTLNLAKGIWFEYILTIERDRKTPPTLLDLQVGLLNFDIVTNNATKPPQRIAKWTTADFHVPEPLSGAGIVARFLERIQVELKGAFRVDEIRVSIVGQAGRNAASRTLRLETIDLYKSRDFHLIPGKNGQPPELRCRLR